jgi:hypothetical protein
MFMVICSFGYAMPSSSFHELYRLVPKYEKDKDSNLNSMVLRSSPLLDGQKNIVHKIDYSQFIPYAEGYGEVLKKFDLKNKNHYFIAISSKERKGDFFKLIYNGENVWVHKEHFRSVRTVEDVYKSKAYIELEKTTQFYSKIGVRFNSKNLVKKIKHKYPIIQSRVIETKWVKNELWFKVILGNVKRICDTDAYLDESVVLWMKPYGKDGNLMFSYSQKGGC